MKKGKVNLFEESFDVFDQRLNEMFAKPKETELDIILKAVSLLIYKNCNNIDIIELYKLLGLENFSKIVMLFDGKTVKFPTKQEITNNLIYALVYYYREIKGFSWDQVKEKFPFEISGISCGIQLKQLDNFIQQNLNELLSKLEKDKKEKEGEN